MYHPYLRVISHIVYIIYLKQIYSILKNDLLSNYRPKEKREFISYFIQYNFIISFRNLSSNELFRYFYPQLYSYKDINDNKPELIALSRNAMVSSSGHIFVLNGYNSIVVYCDASVTDIELPPPSDCIFKYILGKLYLDIENMINDNTHCIPNVQYIQSGTDECLLDKELLDDDQNYGSGYYEFEMVLEKEVETDIKSNKH